MRVRICACDDDELLMELMERALAPFSSIFSKVTTLSGALALIETETYNICLLDLRLKETDKNDSLHAIRTIKAHKCAVIVVSGLPDPRLELDAKEAGADFVVKKDGPNFGKVLKTACDIAILHLPRDSFKSDSFLEHVEQLRKTAAA